MVTLKTSRHAIKQAKKLAKQKQKDEETTVNSQHTRKKNIKKYSIISVAGLIIAIALFFLLSSSGNKPSQHDSFAQCLTANGATMYGAYWCPHCADQKKMFASSFKYIDYVECAKDGKNAEPEKCDQISITSYPTWVIKGEKHSGVLLLTQLAALTNCTLAQ